MSGGRYSPELFGWGGPGAGAGPWPVARPRYRVIPLDPVALVAPSYSPMPRLPPSWAGASATRWWRTDFGMRMAVAFAWCPPGPSLPLVIPLW
jgi:hypothetical protein